MHPGRKFILAAVACLVCQAPTRLFAQEPDAQAARGLGGLSCNVFVVTYEHNPDSAEHEHGTESGEEAHFINPDEAGKEYRTTDYITWLEGYLSAYNVHQYAGNNIAARASMGGMLRFLYRWCSENPDEKFVSAIPALLKRINPENM